MFGLLGWILFGLIVGVIAKLLMPGRDPGGFIGRAMGFYGPGEPAGFLMSTLGAIVLLFIYHKMRRPAVVRGI